MTSLAMTEPVVVLARASVSLSLGGYRLQATGYRLRTGGERRLASLAGVLMKKRTTRRGGRARSASHQTGPRRQGPLVQLTVHTSAGIDESLEPDQVGEVARHVWKEFGGGAIVEMTPPGGAFDDSEIMVVETTVKGHIYLRLKSERGRR